RDAAGVVWKALRSDDDGAGVRADLDEGRVPADGRPRGATLLLWWGTGRARTARVEAAGGISGTGGGRDAVAAVPGVDRVGGVRDRDPDQRDRRGDRVGGVEHAEAGAVDRGGTCPAERARGAERGRGVRFSHRAGAPGAPVDAGEGTGMAVSVVAGAAAPVAPLRLQQSQVFVAGPVAARGPENVHQRDRGGVSDGTRTRASDRSRRLHWASPDEVPGREGVLGSGCGPQVPGVRGVAGTRVQIGR